MSQNQDPVRQELLTNIQEAEQLATQIDTLEEGPEQMRLIYQWAEMVDGVAKLMVQAEELFSPGDLAALQREVNGQDTACWERYRRNIRWLNQPQEPS